MEEKITPIESILVANRGEIACRVMRTAQSLGIRAIAVYSSADRDAPHVKMADDAFELGPAPVGESYLSIDRVMAAIKATNSDAVHPGYGFLSENAAFAKSCAENDIIFIGPDVNAIDIMGDKAKSKRRMIAAGVPCIPGYQGSDQSDSTLITRASEIGFPLMVKAAAGGGGRGMRLVQNSNDLPSAISLARSEAQNSFGSGELILERAIINPRHVEMQIFADKYGHVIHLGERDCSVQRRHQKVLEEAPCPVLTDNLREEMGAAAVKAAKDIDYIGAGTVEFLLDPDGNFYFLEMNTRLQVEHPITEMVTGLDLVDMQIRVARGERINLNQSDISMSGHAIEARLYAEDPSQDFLPVTGPVDLWRPAAGPGVRIDSGIESGGDVSPYYDPMVAKIIAHGATRNEARTKLLKALDATTLFGVTNNKSFLIDALRHPQFANGSATTSFIADNFSENELKRETISPDAASIGAVLLFSLTRSDMYERGLNVDSQLFNWTSASQMQTPFRFMDGDQQIDIAITPVGTNTYESKIGDDEYKISVLKMGNQDALIEINGKRHAIVFNRPDRNQFNQAIQFETDGRMHDLTNLNGILSDAKDRAGAGAILAPMHGQLVDLLVQPGTTVKKGDRLAILEAMKLQHELTADIDGTVEQVHFESGVQVAANALLITIAATED